MYEYILTENGWLLCWGPPPVHVKVKSWRVTPAGQAEAPREPWSLPLDTESVPDAELMLASSAEPADPAGNALSPVCYN
jgi:hypothetical protein